ncbi:MAG: signal peptide peptidase SppA [Acidobacteria bacterium]|nr:signal peptide peptidase SppA [Acidobacteriota bacterium]MBV9474551.1 signal peptide peptidase SppA [Acidobacteriota bacterium]
MTELESSQPNPEPPAPEPAQPSAASQSATAASAAPPQPPWLAPPPPRKSRKGVFFFGALSGCLFAFFGLALLIALGAAYGSDSGEMSIGNDKIAIIPIEGEIVDARDTLDALHKYAKTSSVRGMVVRINSPGGAIAPSQEIYSAIRRVHLDTGKPIVASLDSVAASGGFYIASACDEIVANPGSITGSIGVIMQWFDMKDLVQWAKLKPETITSGPLKDAGSPYREMTDAERQYFQHIVTDLREQFVRDVANGRRQKMKYADVDRIADGRVFTGEEALRLKLVDRLGTIDDAVETAGKLAGIHGEPAKIWPRRRQASLVDLLSGGDAESMIERVVSRRLPKFLYRW